VYSCRKMSGVAAMVRPKRHPLLRMDVSTLSYTVHLRIAEQLHLHDDLDALERTEPSEEQRVWLKRLVVNSKRDVDMFLRMVVKAGPVEAYVRRGKGEASKDLRERVLRASVNMAPSGSGVVVLRNARRVLVLTCAHCVPRCDVGALNVVVAADGSVATSVCVAVDEVADVALLEMSVKPDSILEVLPVADLAAADFAASLPRNVLVCGNPVSPGRSGHRYLPFQFSTGTAEQVAKGDIDPAVPNRGFGYGAELGGLKHNAWTFWGHSGSPLVDTASGEVVGIHNSWDPSNGKRHAVSLPIIRRFFDAHADLFAT